MTDIRHSIRNLTGRLVLLALLMGIFGYLLVWVLEPGPKPWQYAIGARSEFAPGTPYKAPGFKPDPDNHLTDPGTRPLGANQGVEAETKPTPSAVPPPGELTDSTLIVECRQSNGEPFPSVAVTYTILGRRIKDESSIGWHLDYSLRKTETADENGKLRITSKLEYTIDLAANAEGFFSKPVRTSFQNENTVVVLTLAPAGTVRIRVAYDDGLPADESAEFVDLERHYFWSWHLSKEGTATFNNVALDRPLTCRVFASRAGYDDLKVEVPIADLQSGRELQFVIPKSIKKPKSGQLLVRFSSGPIPESATIMLESDPQMPLAGYNDIAAGAKDYLYRALPRDFKYRITVFGSRSWRSDWIQIRAGEQTVLVADLRPGGDIKARLVDARGHPLAGAFMRPSGGGYFDYRFGKTPDSHEESGWLADADGYVTLKGLPAGSIRVEAEAWQHEVVTRVVTITEGSTLDLGDIVLDDAIGEITVEVSGCADGQKYVIIVDQPRGLTFLPHVPVEGPTVKLTGLALRRYNVGIAFAEGSRIVWAETVDLSMGTTSQRITLDAGKVQK